MHTHAHIYRKIKATASEPDKNDVLISTSRTIAVASGDAVDTLYLKIYLTLLLGSSLHSLNYF